jgi:plastocyanin
MKRAIVILSVMVAVLPLSQAALAAEYQVSISNFAFVPHGQHINVGDTIVWRNLDSFSHTSTSDNGVWSSPNLLTNQTYTHVFTGSGAFPYHCSIHISMKDTIFVGAQSGTGDLPPITPQDFELSPNYPNPFNAQTIIKYSIPQTAHVNIEIFNVLGQEVDALVDGQQVAGEHETVWNAMNQSSGVFFYRVNVDGQVKMGRMTLLK